MRKQAGRARVLAAVQWLCQLCIKYEGAAVTAGSELLLPTAPPVDSAGGFFGLSAVRTQLWQSRTQVGHVTPQYGMQ